MRRFIAIVCLSGGCLLLPGTGTAQDAPEDAGEPRPSGRVEPRFGVELMTGALADGPASEEGTGSRGWGLQVSGEVTAFRFLSVSADLGAMDVSDERPFTEETTEGPMSSAVSVFLGTAAAGLRTPPLPLGDSGGPVGWAFVNVGHTWMTGERRIWNCSDCSDQDVALGAGTFWEPGVEVGPGPARWAIRARYRRYGAGSDLQDALMLGVTGRF